MGGVDQTVVTIALPAIQRDLGASAADLQWIVTGYSLVFAALMVAGGTVGDRFGRKRTFLGGVSLFTAGSVLAALAPTIEVLIGARLLTGLGAAFMVPTTLALIASVYPKSERGKAIGIWAAVAGSAIAFGPIVGGVIVQAAGWQAVFWINVPLGLFAVVAGARYLVETRAEDAADQTLDVVGLALIVPGLFTLTYGLIRGSDAGWGEPGVVACLVAAAVLLGAFALWERRAPAPMLRPGLLRRPGFLGPLTSLTLMYFALVGILIYLSIYYQTVRDYSPLTTALFFLPTTVVLVACAPFAGGLADRIGPRRFGVLGVLCVGASLAALIGLDTDTSVWVLLLSQLLLGLGVGLSDPPLSATILNAVPTADAGVASATEGMSEELGGAFGVAVLGGLVATFSASAFADTIHNSALSAAGQAEAIAGFSPLQAQLDTAPGLGASAQAIVTRAADEALAAGLGDMALVAALICVGAAVVAALTVPRSTVSDEPVAEPPHPRRIRHHLRHMREAAPKP